MKGLIVLALLLLFFIILFSLSITFRVLYTDTFTITVGIGKLRYTLLPATKKVRKEKKEKEEKGDVKNTVFSALDIIKMVLPPIKDLLKKVRVTALSVTITVGCEDSATTAVNYGKISVLVYGGLATLRNLLKIKVSKVDIGCDFLKDKTEQEIFFKVKIRIFSIILAILRMGYNFLVNILKRTKDKNISGTPEEK